MRKIALIEDDADLYALVKYNLEKEGFAVVGAQTGRGVIELCRRERPDLVLLDIMLPDSDGLEICKGIRRHPELAHVPVIFLTARASETDRIVGLELGANDYIVKPFFVRELIARIKIQFRGQTTATKVLKSAALELDRSRCEARLDGNLLTLTATEFRLLEFLMSRPEVVFSREQLLDAVWGHDRAVTDRTVDVYILRLRQKIEADPTNPLLIRSVRGFGYSFNNAPQAQEAEQQPSAAIAAAAPVKHKSAHGKAGYRFDLVFVFFHASHCGHPRSGVKRRGEIVQSVAASYGIHFDLAVIGVARPT